MNAPLEKWWKSILQFFKFAAKVPMAGVAVVGAGMVAFLIFMVLWRTTQWTWVNWFSKPW